MINKILPKILAQGTKQPATNLFPIPQMPDSLLEVLKGDEPDITPPVPVSDRYRGRILYDRAKCIGCRLCTKVCPANATEYLPDEKKIVIHVDRCCFCAQCVEICPVKSLAMSDESLNSSYIRKEEIVKDSGPMAPKADDAKAAAVYEIDEAKCIGCTKCARTCPVGAISGELKKPHKIDDSVCAGCGQCADACPKKAIHEKA